MLTFSSTTKIRVETLATNGPRASFMQSNEVISQTARVTNYVLLETLNWIHERQRHDIAVDLKARLGEIKTLRPNTYW